MTEARCENCRFWLRIKRSGRCRRYPPQRLPFIVYGFTVDAHTAFPRIEADDWCGEHEHQPAPTRQDGGK